MICAYEMGDKELTARLEALADHTHPEILNLEVNAIWRQVCREAAKRIRSSEADQRDAARYRWLLDNLESLAEWMDNDIPADRLDRTIDANMAIDAAMRQSAGEGK